MSREIKFRAWDKKEKRMLQVMQWSWMVCNGTDLVPHDHTLSGFYIDGDNHGHHKKWSQRNEVELVQFTGLKDKNGVEIYEGDIVRITEMPNIVDVVTMDRFPVFWLVNETFGYEGEDLEPPEYCEVIGNIYENPELL